MGVIRKASKIERLTLFLYQNSLWIVLLVAAGVSFLLNHYSLMCIIKKNAVTLAVTGVAVAAFLFTAQSILISISSENRFIKAVRNDGNYFPYIHRFCRRAEIVFVIDLIPMLYMGNDIYNIVVFAVFVYGLIFTVWAMWLIGKILIISEKHPI